MISNISEEGVKLTGYWECSGDIENPKWLSAYLDTGGKWTIGIGCIRYPNGQPVKKGDKITFDQMETYYEFEIKEKISKVIFLTRDDINQNQFDALLDCTFNIGSNGLQKSTLLKVLNNNLTDINIVDRFLDWRYDNGVMNPGLLRRRMSNAYFYFTGELKVDWVNFRTFSVNSVNEVKQAIKSYKLKNP